MSHLLKFQKHKAASIGMWVNLVGKKKKKDLVLLCFSSTIWLLKVYMLPSTST